MRPLGALVVTISRDIVYEVSIVFIQRVVCEVYITRVLVFGIIAIVFDSSKPRESFFIDVDSEWIEASDAHIHPQVKLIPVY